MISHCPLLLVLTSTTFAISQQPLGINPEHSNFISSSIFGRRDVDIKNLLEPVILTPAYQARDFNEEPAFTGLGTFAHLPFIDCTKPDNNGAFDIGIIGHPFDLGVSYRSGARFGPNGARQGARRLSPSWGWR